MRLGHPPRENWCLTSGHRGLGPTHEDFGHSRPRLRHTHRWGRVFHGLCEISTIMAIQPARETRPRSTSPSLPRPWRSPLLDDVAQD